MGFYFCGKFLHSLQDLGLIALIIIVKIYTCTTSI